MLPWCHWNWRFNKFFQAHKIYFLKFPKNAALVVLIRFSITKRKSFLRSLCRNIFRRPYDLSDIFHYFENGSYQLNTMIFQFQAGCSNSHSLEVKPTCDEATTHHKQCKINSNSWWNVWNPVLCPQFLNWKDSHYQVHFGEINETRNDGDDKDNLASF